MGGDSAHQIAPTWSLRTGSVPRNDFSVVPYCSQLRLLYRSCENDGSQKTAGPRWTELEPETCTTCGMKFRPSMVVMSVTLAHASLCGSLATRMMHKFVRGEKYLTDSNPVVRVSSIDSEKR